MFFSQSRAERIDLDSKKVLHTCAHAMCIAAEILQVHKEKIIYIYYHPCDGSIVVDGQSEVVNSKAFCMYFFNWLAFGVIKLGSPILGESTLMHILWYFFM